MKIKNIKEEAHKTKPKLNWTSKIKSQQAKSNLGAGGKTRFDLFVMFFLFFSGISESNLVFKIPK